MSAITKRWQVTGQVVMITGLDVVVHAPTVDRAREAAISVAYANHDDISEVVVTNLRELGLVPDELSTNFDEPALDATTVWILTIAEAPSRRVSIHVSREDAVRALATFCRAQRRPRDLWKPTDDDAVVIDSCCPTRYAVTLESTTLAAGVPAIVWTVTGGTGAGGGGGGKPFSLVE